MLCARTRSFAGSQVVKVLVRLGKQPASPAPKKNCVITMERKFQVQPVAAVKKLHHSTIRMSTLRGPRRSPRYPPGISKSGVGTAEGGEGQAHLARIEAQVLGDKRRGEREGDAVDVGDHGQGDGENDHPIAYAGRRLCRGYASASFMNW